jgi:ubiquinone/menaquinone biosynthesis C-methylase UbiE
MPFHPVAREKVDAMMSNSPNRFTEFARNTAAASTDLTQAVQLHTPTADISQLFDCGVLGIPLVQYLNWADRAGLFTFMSSRSAVTTNEIVNHTILNLRGVQAFLGVLCGLNIVTKDANSQYTLSDVGREYLDARSPFYVGLSLHGMLKAPIPKRMLKGAQPRRFSENVCTFWDKIQYWRNPYQWGRPERLRIQHSRNFPAAVVAARSGFFNGIDHLVDIGGGSGVFCIPLALDRPNMRLTLVDLPRSLQHIKEFLKPYDVDDRIELAGIDVYKTPWPLPTCDGVLFANFLHTCDDDECRSLLRGAFRLLAPHGRVVLHEMLWNERGDGPLLTALWNFWMVSVSAGHQRCATELSQLLAEAGFCDFKVKPTAGCFSLVTGVKPA